MGHKRGRNRHRLPANTLPRDAASTPASRCHQGGPSVTSAQRSAGIGDQRAASVSAKRKTAAGIQGERVSTRGRRRFGKDSHDARVPCAAQTHYNVTCSLIITQHAVQSCSNPCGAPRLQVYAPSYLGAVLERVADSGQRRINSLRVGNLALQCRQNPPRTPTRSPLITAAIRVNAGSIGACTFLNGTLKSTRISTRLPERFSASMPSLVRAERLRFRAPDLGGKGARRRGENRRNRSNTRGKPHRNSLARVYTACRHAVRMSPWRRSHL